MTKLLSILAITVFVFGCVSYQVYEPPTGNRNPAFFGAKTIANSDVIKASSSGRLQLSEAQVITDNDASFESKLEAIHSAQKGEVIRLVYYIYSDDHSSSKFTKALIAAAQRGVQVRLLVDYLTNYKQFDLFAMMQSRGIQVRLYGRPTGNIVRDALFLTRPCPAYQGIPDIKHCANNKWESINAELEVAPEKENYADFFSGLFLAGLSAKNPLALQTSVLVGQQIDMAKYKSANGSPAEQAKLKEFFGLLFKAKVKGDVAAALKVQVALSMYAADLNPIMNELFGRIPFDQMESSSAKDWEHISDYTHHKLLLVGDRFFQLGGRNIENSYHMKKNNLSAKYTFMDVDFAANVVRGGKAIADAYDSLWNFQPMVVDLNTAQKFAPFDFIGNPQAARMAVGKCMQSIPNKTSADREKMEACIKNTFWQAGAKKLEQRIEEKYQDMELKAKKYEDEYLPNRVFTDNWKNDKQYAFSISAEELRASLITYIENLHFNKAKPQERVYGAMNGQFFLPWNEHELNYGRGIHYLWIKALENTCAVSAADKKPRRIIFHTAYFLPPANMMRAFGKMMDGTWDCRNVRVTFLTNSIHTTDLNIINVYARYQMKAFFDVYSARKAHYGSEIDQFSAKFEYYEYLPILDANGKEDPNKKTSLHSKVSILGDDAIVGSANADVRSFYMDTNNGVYIRGAKELINEYVNWIDGLLIDPTKVKNLTPEHLDGTVTMERLFNEDDYLINALLEKYGWSKKISPNTRQEARKLQQNFGQSIVDTIKMILSKDYIEGQSGDSEKIKRQQELERRYNRSLQVL